LPWLPTDLSPAAHLRWSPAEVNLVNLERVGFNLRNFDMVFIWKDLNRDVGRIDSIPSTSLDTIKVGRGWRVAEVPGWMPARPGR
jgi:nucleosome binding factor SPN SPT16 subunit